MAVNMRKVAIVGCGRSGSAVSFSLMQSGLFSEMVLVDSLANKAERVAHDLAYGISFVKPMNIYAGGYDDLADAGIIVIAAGEPRLSTDSRMEFIRKNVNVLERIIPKIAAKNTEAISSTSPTAPRRSSIGPSPKSIQAAAPISKSPPTTPRRSPSRSPTANTPPRTWSERPSPSLPPTAPPR